MATEASLTGSKNCGTGAVGIRRSLLFLEGKQGSGTHMIHAGMPQLSMGATRPISWAKAPAANTQRCSVKMFVLFLLDPALLVECTRFC